LLISPAWGAPLFPDQTAAIAATHSERAISVRLFEESRNSLAGQIGPHGMTSAADFGLAGAAFHHPPMLTAAVETPRYRGISSATQFHMR
jgi:hypothetical protein